MPADPPSTNPPPAPVPHGQAHPAAPHLPQHQAPLSRFPPQVPPQHHHQPPSRLVHGHNPLSGRSQYAVPMNSPHISSMPSSQQQSQQQQSPQQQPPPPPQGGQHRPNAVPMQQAPYYMGGYPPMTGYPPMSAQYGNMPPGYVPYQQVPYGFGGVPQVANPQQPGPPNPRNSRSYGQQVSSQGSPRQPPTRVVPPAPRKKVLAIVDPDTNEEVKVSKVESKPAPKAAAPPPAAPASTVKIPLRTIRPLELVADPADSSPSMESQVGSGSSVTTKTKQAPTPQSTVTAEMSENKEQPVAAVSPDVTTSTPESSNVAESNVSGLNDDDEVDAVANSLANVSVSDERGGFKSSDRTAIPSQKKAELAAPSAVEMIDKTPASNSGLPDSGMVNVAGTERSGRPSSTLSRGGISDSVAPPEEDSSPADLHEEPATAGTGSVTEVVSNGISHPERQAPVSHAASAESSAEGPVPDDTLAPATSLGDTDVNVAHNTPRRERPVFREGERRVYAPHWMLSLRQAVDPKKNAEYESALLDNSINKSGAPSGNPRGGDLRGTKTMRVPVASPGPLSADPRGKKTFTAQAGPGFVNPSRAPQGMMSSGGVGSYDAFDLRSARSSNPPPPPKGQQGQMRDPRGSRGGRDRFDGPVRGGQGPLDPFLDHGPVESLKMSENGWKRAKESDDEVTAKVKQIRSLLNKLTLEKFEKIFKQIIDINISSYEILVGVVKEVFEKALFEPKFSGMYAELCVRLDNSTKDMLRNAQIMDSNGKPIFFKNILLNKCREEFIGLSQAAEESMASNGQKAEESGSGVGEEKAEDALAEDLNAGADVPGDENLTPAELKRKAALAKAEKDLRATKAKRRMLANVTFIGELYLKDLLREQIIHRQCIQKLLQIGATTKEEDVLEALCKLLSKTGAKLSANKDAVPYIDKYFTPLISLSRDNTLPARVRFMLQDLIEQRANNWKVRREEVGAKTIAEIHEDIKKEERAKAEAQAAARDRRGRGGGGMHNRHDRMQQNFQPRVAMTMASRQRTGSAVSRSQALLDKHASRGPTSGSSNFDNMRLGPRGPKSNSATPGTVGGLRPGGGGSRYSALSMQEPRENALQGQSGDARRGSVTKKWLGTSRRAAMSAVGRPEPAEIKVELMDPEKLKLKATSLVTEYWSIADMKEFQECVEQEVRPPNYPKFLEEALKFSIEAKAADKDKSNTLFIKSIGGIFPGRDYVSAFAAIIPTISDMEMDNPRAPESLAKFIGEIASTGKLGLDNDPSLGISLVMGPLSTITDPKRVSKFVISMFAGLHNGLRRAGGDEASSKAIVRKVFEGVDVDLAEKMSSWNPMRGVSVLSDMLSSEKLSFLVPLVPVELELKKTLESNPTAESVHSALKCGGLPGEELRTEAFMRMIIRIVFDWLMMAPPASIKDTFSSLMRDPVLKCFGVSIPRNVQMAALLAVQSYIVKNVDILPAHSEESYDKPAAIAFNSLYFADLVEEEVFVQWKDDTELSTKIEGKEKLLVQTSKFFQWLSTAPMED